MENVAHNRCTTCGLLFIAHDVADADHEATTDGTLDAARAWRTAQDKRAEAARAVDMATGRPAHLRLASERGTYAGSMVAPAGELPSLHDPDWTELGPCDDCEPTPTEDMLEQRDRAAAVARVLESCHEELVRLEMIATSDATDINVLSAVKGYVARARNMLRGRFA